MDKLHNSRMSPYEKIEALESIRCQIQGAWRTDEIRRQKPTPQVLLLLYQCCGTAVCCICTACLTAAHIMLACLWRLETC